jgi:hypothetical protein
VDVSAYVLLEADARDSALLMDSIVDERGDVRIQRSP